METSFNTCKCKRKNWTHALQTFHSQFPYLSFPNHVFNSLILNHNQRSYHMVLLWVLSIILLWWSTIWHILLKMKVEQLQVSYNVPRLFFHIYDCTTSSRRIHMFHITVPQIISLLEYKRHYGVLVYGLNLK